MNSKPKFNDKPFEIPQIHAIIIFVVTLSVIFDTPIAPLLPFPAICQAFQLNTKTLLQSLPLHVRKWNKIRFVCVCKS